MNPFQIIRRYLSQWRAIARSGGQAPLLRWIAAGGVFMFINLGLLFLSVDLMGLQVVFGTLLSAEICTILRFLVNDRWVFGHRRPTWQRLFQYHVANATAFGVWWGATNALNLWGMHYLLAAVVAVAGSMGFSIAANFYWIWHKRNRPASE